MPGICSGHGGPPLFELETFGRESGVVRKPRHSGGGRATAGGGRDAYEGCGRVKGVKRLETAPQRRRPRQSGGDRARAEPRRLGRIWQCAR